MMGRHHAPLGAIAGGIAATFVAASPAAAGPLPGDLGMVEFLVGRGARLVLPVLLGLVIGGVYGLLPDIDQDGSDITFLPDMTAGFFDRILGGLRARIPHQHRRGQHHHETPHDNERAYRAGRGRKPSARAHKTGERRRQSQTRRVQREGGAAVIGYAALNLCIRLLMLIITVIGHIATLIAHILARVIHVISGGHRRMTHTVWLAVLFSLPLLYFCGPLPFWAAFAGYMCHLLADATTHSGVDFFRPLTQRSQWIVPRFLTYHTGTPAETAMFWFLAFVQLVGWGLLVVNKVPRVV